MNELATGIIKTWTCFVKGERFNIKENTPCFYWGKINFCRGGWSENGVKKYSEKFEVELKYHEDENAPKWLRDSVISSNTERYEDPKKDFNTLESAKSFIRKNIVTSSRVYWKSGGE